MKAFLIEGTASYVVQGLSERGYAAGAADSSKADRWTVKCGACEILIQDIAPPHHAGWVWGELHPQVEVAVPEVDLVPRQAACVGSAVRAPPHHVSGSA